MKMLEYILHIPPELPKGKFLVHNRVRAQRPIGRNGFRVWIADDVSGKVVCDCGFAGLKNGDKHAHFTS